MHLVSFACHPYLRVYGVTSVQTVVLNLPSGHKFVRESVLCAAGVAKAVSVDMAVAWVSHYC